MPHALETIAQQANIVAYATLPGAIGAEDERNLMKSPGFLSKRPMFYSFCQLVEGFFDRKKIAKGTSRLKNPMNDEVKSRTKVWQFHKQGKWGYVTVN